MVLQAPTADVQLPWDYFLNKQPDAEMRRPHVEAFRRVDWPAIKRELANEGFQGEFYEIPDGLEPHWVEPGKAVLWQEQRRSTIEVAVDEKGQPILNRHGLPIRERKEESVGWTATSPLPVGNANQFAYYIRKGMRLRPPMEGAAPEIVKESEAQAEKEEPPVALFVCNRHGYDFKAFKTWKGYIRHCATAQEVPVLEPPEVVLKRARKYPLYCYIHNIGFRSERLAKRHIDIERLRLVRGTHPTLEQMAIKTGGK